MEQLKECKFDLLVIGGGITGAGIALDAAARGLKVALVDMQDFAAGTSGRSTKLIHGGLRYLKQLELKLVAEVGKEREIIHRIAPHLTIPEPMLLPITKTGSFGRYSTRIAMWVYEWLAGVKRSERHRLLGAAAARAAEPLLSPQGLLGAVLFYEYRTDDARLTIEVARAAAARGAVLLNYMKVTGFEYASGRIAGARAEDQLHGQVVSIRASHVVNAAGPWVDEIDQLDKKEQGNKLNITKGVHIVVDSQKLPVRQSLYFDAPDRRMVFVIPREGKTYIGTTDTFYKAGKVHPAILPEDRAYLLACVNAYFPAQQLGEEDIESGWAGLRPLINKPGKGPSEISRKDEIFEWPSGLITIAGGKLTGYRKMAQRLVDLVVKKIITSPQAENRRPEPCTTAQIFLAGGTAGNNDPAALLSMSAALQQQLALTEAEARTLVYRYGPDVQQLYAIISVQLKEGYSGQLPLVLYAQLLYVIENESCYTPCDFFIRRTGALYFNIRQVREWKEAVSAEMQRQLGWSTGLKQQLDAELEAILATLPAHA